MKSILVIQPDEAHLEALTTQLKRLNFSNSQVFLCRSLSEALAAAPEDICLILANLAFTPVRDTSPLKELKKRFVHIPIIILADTDEPENHVYAISQGAQDVLVKGEFDYRRLGRAMTMARERMALLLRLKNVLEDYKRHFDNGPIPMWIVDEKTMRFLIVNNAATEKYGYTKEEFSRMSLIDIRPKEDVAAMLNSFSSRDTDYFDAGYWRHMKKNGAVFFVHVYSHSTRFENIDARLSFVVDVNDKLMAEKRNKELMALITQQKEQLDNILLSIGEAIWSRDADTHELLYGNRAYYELYGFSPADKVLREPLDMARIHPDDRTTFLEKINEVKAKGKVDYTYRYLNADGSVKILKGKATFIKGKDGKPDTIDGTTTDITREKELYDKIRNSEQRLLTTINNTNDLIWSVDRNLRIIYCNHAYQDFFNKLFGISLDEGDYVLGNWHSEAFNDRRKKEYARGLAGETFTTIVEEHHSGDIQYFEINSSPIIDIDEKIIGVNCVARDITAEEKNLKKINRQNEQLREIAWIQSHKVRGPVATILGLIPLFDDEAGGDEHNKDIIEKLRIATNDLDAVIKEIVSKSREINDDPVPRP